MKKRLFSFMTAVAVLAVLAAVLPPVAVTYADSFSTLSDVEAVNHSAQLKVQGNKVVNAATGETVRLAGVNVPSLEWYATGEHVYTSVAEACDNWNANVIRLPLSSARWFGLTEEQAGKGAEPYRRMVAEVVAAVQERGKHIILDCHWSDAGQTEELKKPENINTVLVNNTTGQHKMPDEGVREFWLDIVKVYGNNPAVLFDLYNEPHSVSWEIWRNGGMVTDQAAGETVSYQAVGHQELVETIRDAGAKNVIVAGGLDYAYSLTGIAGRSGNDTKVYALEDRASDGDASKAGYGIIYDTHIYPWKNNSDKWQTAVGCVLDKYPVIVGENGWEKQTNETHNISTLKQPRLNAPYWVNELLDWIDDPTNAAGEKTNVPLNWTAWTFHPNAQPTTFSNWYYEPTPFWGEYVKKRLLSYPGGQAEAKNYSNRFTADSDWIARYVDADGKTPGYGALKSKTYENNAVCITYNGTEPEIRMEPLPRICFKGMQSLHLTLAPSVGGNVEIGIAETDGELWTKRVDLAGGTENKISIPIDELKLTPFEGANGIFTGVAASVYIKPAGKSGEMRISNLVINRGGEELGGYAEGGAERRQTLEYVVQNDIVLRNGEQAAAIAQSPRGTDILHFLGQGTGNVTVSLMAEGKQYETRTALAGGDGWKHIRLRPENFGELSSFENVTDMKVAGQEGAVLRHITFTNIEPPEYCPSPENKVDYCVNFEDDGDALYKMEYNSADIDVTEVTEDGNTALRFAVKKSGDFMLRVNPNGSQPHVNLRDAKTLSFDIKGDGSYANINMGIMGTKLTTRVPIILEDDHWHRITLNLEKTGVFIPQFIAGIKFYLSNCVGGTYLIDNISFTSGDTVIPDENVTETFDNGEPVFRWSGAVQAAPGKEKNGRRLSLNQQPVTALLDRGKLNLWQRDLSGFRYVSFYAKTDTPGQTIALALQDRDGNEMGRWWFSLDTTEWENVEIPLLSGETALRTGAVGSISWTAEKNCALDVDNLGLNKEKPRLSAELDAAVRSNTKLLVHDDFEGGIEVERSVSALEVREDGVPGWKAVGTPEAISHTGLFAFTDYCNTSSFLSTATDEEVYTLYHDSGNKAVLYRNFERPDENGLTTVEMRVKYPAYNANEIILCEKSGLDLTNNAVIAKIKVDPDGNLFYQDEFIGSTTKNSTMSQTKIQPGDWVYLRAIVNSAEKTVTVYAGHSFETLQPWTEEKSAFNFAANNAKAPYVLAGSGFGALAISGKGVVGIDDVRIYHKTIITPPEAREVTLSGIPRAGEVLSAAYTFYDTSGNAESGSVGRWESAADREFTRDVRVVSGEHSVSSGIGSSYQVTERDTGRYLKFSVTPKSASESQTAGEEAFAVTAKVGAADVVKAVFTRNGEDASLEGISGYAGVRIFATNTTMEQKTLEIYIAVYEPASDVLKSLYKETLAVAANTFKEIAIDTAEFAVDEDSEYKMFVWSESQTPYVLPVEAVRFVHDFKALAQESFTADDGTDLCTQTADPERGWASGWKTIRKIDNISTVADIPANTYEIKNNAMTTVNPQYGGAGGYGFGIFRYLADDSKIKLNEDGEYFIRYTIPEVQYMVSASHNYQTQTLGFYTENKNKFSVGIKRKDNMSNYMVFNTNFSGAPLEYRVENKEKYTFVIRISARANDKDLCRIKVFRGDEKLTWFPLSWDYEAAASKNDVIDALALVLSNHASTQVYPQYDDIQVLKCAPVYVERSSEIGLTAGEILRVSLPEKNVYGHPQKLESVEWFLVKGDEHICAGTGIEFKVPDKGAADLVRARVTMTDQTTGKQSGVWAVSDEII